MSAETASNSSIPIPGFHLSPSLDWQSEWVQLRNQKRVIPRPRMTSSTKCPSVYEIVERLLYKEAPGDFVPFPKRAPTVDSKFIDTSQEEMEDDIAETGLSDSNELGEALHDLRSSIEEAQEEEFPIPSGIAMENAEQFIRDMYALSPRRLEVYPTPDGEIAVVAPSPGRSVMILCDSDGGGLLMAHLGGGNWRARYSNARDIPPFLVRRAISGLDAAE